MRFACLVPLLGACVVGSSEDASVGADGSGKGDIGGEDSRRERYQIEHAALRDAARSSAATFLAEDIKYDATRGLWTAPNATALGEREMLCDGERFAQQPSASWCSATLIADDLVLTAGHCVAYTPCDEQLIVFDYAYQAKPQDLMQVARDISPANVYRCLATVAFVHTIDYDTHRGADVAILRLDRKVTDRAPATLGWNTTARNGSAAYLVGHPSGLPQKLATGRIVDGGTNPEYIVHDADSKGGNSGGGIFDANGTLLGVHSHSSGVRYVPGPDDDSCYITAVCGENAECTDKPHAYSLQALQAHLSPELRTRLGL
jgi:hypothetical protein